MYKELTNDSVMEISMLFLTAVNNNKHIMVFLIQWCLSNSKLFQSPSEHLMLILFLY